MNKKTTSIAEKVAESLSNLPQPSITAEQVVCIKKELGKILGTADSYIAEHYIEMRNDPTWRHAAQVVEELILSLDSETEDKA